MAAGRGHRFQYNREKEETKGDASSLQAMAIFEMAQKLDLVDPGYYRAKYLDPATKTTQKMEIGQISAGDTKQITDLCDKIGVEYTRA